MADVSASCIKILQERAGELSHDNRVVIQGTHVKLTAHIVHLLNVCRGEFGNAFGKGTISVAQGSTVFISSHQILDYRVTVGYVLYYGRETAVKNETRILKYNQVFFLEQSTFTSEAFNRCFQS